MANKLTLFFLFISLTFFSFTQMKRACFGIYKGEIEGYNMGKSNELIQIDPTSIEVQFLKDHFFMFLGDQKYEGTWKVLLETKAYYLVEATIDREAPERLMVYKKERKVLREGISPQPNAILVKSRL